MTPTILVPHDGSPASDRAVPVALAFASATDAALLFTRVCEVRVSGAGAIAGEAGVAVVPPYLAAQPSREAAARDVDRLAGRVRHAYGVDAGGEALEAPDAAEALLTRAEQLAPQLIVMGTRGHSRLARALLGSVADRVTRESHRPVVLVPPGVDQVAGPYALRRVLVALDGTAEGEIAADHAAELVGDGPVAFELLSVVQPVLVSGVLAPPALCDATAAADARRSREAYVGNVAARLRAAGHPVSTRVEEMTDPARAILDAAREDQVDLVAMATHGRGGLRRLARGSVTDGVVGAAAVPVLVVRPAQWVVPAGVPS